MVTKVKSIEFDGDLDCVYYEIDGKQLKADFFTRSRAEEFAEQLRRSNNE